MAKQPINLVSGTKAKFVHAKGKRAAQIIISDAYTGAILPDTKVKILRNTVTDFEIQSASVSPITVNVAASFVNGTFIEWVSLDAEGGVSVPNTPPKAINSTTVVDVTAPYVGKLQASDIDNQVMSFSLLTQPNKGSVSDFNSATGSFKYTPRPNQSGVDSFLFRVHDGVAFSEKGTVTLVLNRPPVATPARYDVAFQGTINAALAGVDPDKNAITFELMGNASKGVVTLLDAKTGAFKYTANEGQNGADTFVFRVHDGRVHSAPASVEITIKEPAEAPIGFDKDKVTLNPKQKATHALRVEKGNVTAFEIVQATAGFNVSVDAKGVVTIVPPESAANAHFEFQWRCSDGVTWSAPATVHGWVRPSYLGQNLWFHEDWAPQHPFLDRMKQARRPWQQVNVGGWGGNDNVPVPVDSNQWPTHAPPAGKMFHTIIQAGLSPDAIDPGTWIIRWKGNATVQCNRPVLKASPNRLEISMPEGSTNIFAVGITAGVVEPGSLQVFRADYDEQAYDAGQRFGQRFLDQIRPFGLIRFMDWMATNDHTNTAKETRTFPESFSYAGQPGVPLEVIADLCNEQNHDCYITIPHTWSKSYITFAATLFRDRLKPHLRLYVENSNEVWNGKFSQSEHFQRIGDARAAAVVPGFNGSPGSFQNKAAAFADRGIDIGEIFETVFGVLATGSRVIRCVGAQLSNPGVADQFLEARPNNRGSLVTAKKVEMLVQAPYFDGDANSKSFPNVDAFFAYLNESVAGTPRVWLFDESVPEWRKTMESTIVYAKNLATSKGLRLGMYEGGASFWKANDSVMDIAQYDSRMGPLYIELLDMWKRAGGEVPLLYAMSAPNRGSPRWGAVRNDNEIGEDSPKLTAILDWMDANP